MQGTFIFDKIERKNSENKTSWKGKKIEDEDVIEVKKKLKESPQKETASIKKQQHNLQSRQKTS